MSARLPALGLDKDEMREKDDIMEGNEPDLIVVSGRWNVGGPQGTCTCARDGGRELHDRPGDLSHFPL